MKILFTILLLFIMHDEYPPFDGFSSFRINQTTTSEMTKIESELGIKFTKWNKSYWSEQDKATEKKPFYIEVIPSETERASNASKCPDARVFFLSHYKVSDFYIRNLLLEFYKDTLISIHCDNDTKLNEAIKLKYGPGVTEHKTRKVSCVNSYYNNTNELTEEEFDTRWFGGPHLLSWVHVETYYDSKCRIKYSNYLFISDTLRDLEKLKCNYEISEQADSIKQASQKQKLKDF